MDLAGCHIDRHTIQLPQELFNLLGTTDMRNRLKGQFKLIDASTFEVVLASDGKEQGVPLLELRQSAAAIRKKYLRPFGKGIGNVILKKNKERFTEEVGALRKSIEAFRSACRAALEAEFSKSRGALLEAFIPSVLERPPEALRMDLLSDRPDETTARKYINGLLNRCFPDIEAFGTCNSGCLSRT